MAPTQPNQNGQSATPSEPTIPGLTLATYSRSTDPAFAPRSIKHKPRETDSGTKRKVDTTSLDDVKRPKSDHVSTTGTPQSLFRSISNAHPLPTSSASDTRGVSVTESAGKDSDNRPDVHTPTGRMSQTPNEISRSPSLPIYSSTTPTPIATTTTPADAAIADSIAPGLGSRAVERADPPQYPDAPKSNNLAEAALFAIFGRGKPPTSTSSVASPRSADLDTAVRSSGEQDTRSSPKDPNLQPTTTHISSTTSIHPATSAAAPPSFQHQVIPTPPQTPVTADIGRPTAMIVDPPVNSVNSAPCSQVEQRRSSGNTPSHSLQSSALSYPPRTEIQTPPLTPATAPVSTLADCIEQPTTTTSVPPSPKIGIVNHTSPGPPVPPIPLDAIATLQSVSADLFMALGKGDNNENQLFAAAGKLSACLQANFMPHMDVWRADAMKPRAMMAMVPKADDMVCKAIQAITTVEPKADDMLSKAIQTTTTVTTVEPEAVNPQRISFAMPQPQTIVSTSQKDDDPEHPLGIPPSRDVVRKELDGVQKELDAVQKQLHSAKVTINNQAEKVKVQMEDLRRKDIVITGMRARSKQWEEENSRLAMNPQTIGTPVPFRHAPVAVMSRGMQNRELAYLKRQLERTQADNIRLRDLLHSNGIPTGLDDDDTISHTARERVMTDDSYEEVRGTEDRRSDHGNGQETDDRRARVRGEEIEEGRRGQVNDSGQGMSDRRHRRSWMEERDRQGSRDSAGLEAEDCGNIPKETNPTTPTRGLSIRGHAQSSPQAPMSNTRRTSGGLDKMATLMADFTELIAEKSNRRLSATGSMSNELRTTLGRSYSQDPLLSGSSNRSDYRINSPARSDRTVDNPRRSPTVSSDAKSRAVRAAECDRDSRSPWERSRAEGKIIPTGPRSDRPATPPIGPIPPPIGPRLPAKTSRKREDGEGAYYSKDQSAKITLDRYNRLG